MRKLLILALILFTLSCSQAVPQSTPASFLQTPKGGARATRDEHIRGNKRSMIYHWPGCPNYDDIAPANRVEFKTRAEAEAAGYRAARNCH
jgi:hypothetical protein